MLDPTAPIVFSLLSGPSISDPLRSLLPTGVVAALEARSEQMQLLVIEPLLVSEPVDLERRFTELFGRFVELYLSGVLLVLGTMGDLTRFLSLAPHSFRAAEDIIRSKVGLELGSEEGAIVLRGLATIQRVVNGTLRAISNPATRSRLEDARLTELAQWTVAYFQAVAPVLWVANGRISIPIRQDNVTQLAQWSANYANGCYAIARSSGILLPASPTGPLPQADPEDVELANAGLEGYAETLAAEESE